MSMLEVSAPTPRRHLPWCDEHGEQRRRCRSPGGQEAGWVKKPEFEAGPGCTRGFDLTHTQAGARPDARRQRTIRLSETCSVA